MTAPSTRAELRRRLFPGGIPELWCPLITHYRDDGSIDRERMAAHLRQLAPHVKGFLILGSTGDGWELSESEVRQVLEIALEEAGRLHLHLLIGVLKTSPEEMARMLGDTLRWIESKTGLSTFDALEASRVRGFTICPPRGKDLSQRRISDALETALKSGVPVALYQLPQVTQNEMSPELLADLARRYPNFILFKDTSGADRVALSGVELGGVFLVRGAEGDYVRWLKAGGGPYDGFLLSTANGFGAQLQQVIQLLETGQGSAALALAGRLTGAVEEVFALVADLPHGNAFANANKAMDHFFAHGKQAAQVEPPRLHAGGRLPVDVIRRTGEALERYGFLPERGYWQ